MARRLLETVNSQDDERYCFDATTHDQQAVVLDAREQAARCLVLADVLETEYEESRSAVRDQYPDVLHQAGNIVINQMALGLRKSIPTANWVGKQK